MHRPRVITSYSIHYTKLYELNAEITKAPLGEFVRYLCLDGRLQCIPQSPLKILRAPLVSWGEKLRVLADLSYNFV